MPMRRNQIVFAFLIALLPISALLADIPGPGQRRRPPIQPPNAAVEANLVIEVDSNAKNARLVVPRKFTSDKPGNNAPGDDDLSVAEPERSWPRTAIAGVSLAAALACGGLWLVRRGKSDGRGTAMLLAFGCLLGCSAVAWANAGPPPRQPSPPTNISELFSGKVTLEYVAEGDSIKLILPPDAAKKMNKSDEPKGNSGSPPPKPKDQSKPE
jgi:hypothetical protein